MKATVESQFEPALAVAINEKYGNENTRYNFVLLAKYLKKHTSLKGDLTVKMLKQKKEELLELFASEDKGKFNTRNNYLGYLWMVFSAAKEKMPQELDQLRKKMKKQRTKNDEKLNDDKIADIDTLEILEEVRARRKKNPRTLGNWQREAIFTILVDTPLRLNELVGMRWVDNDEDNYIDLEEGSIVIRNHKAKKSLGTKKHKLNDDAIAFLKLFKEKWPYDFVLIRNEKPYQSEPATQGSLRSLFHRFMKKWKAEHNIGKEVGIHNLRQNYATKKLNALGLGAVEMQAIRELQNQMGHTNFYHTLTTYFRTLDE